jgi:hypothetical protein
MTIPLCTLVQHIFLHFNFSYIVSLKKVLSSEMDPVEIRLS